jgi:hypothetical protein
MRSLALLVALGACHHAAPTVPPVAPPPQTQLERMLALLPDGAQIVVELDLARLRANAVVGPLATSALADLGADARLPGLPVVLAGSPLAHADAVVLAAYGVGTAQAATITLLATSTDVPGAARISPDVVAVGPDEWTSQLATRAALAAQHPLIVPKELVDLRAHAEPKGATGAVVRVTARLTFDARVAFGRLTGFDAPPAQISLWADVADDIAVVVDADSIDPGDKAAKDAAKRLAATIRGVLAAVGDAPLVRGLGVAASVADARLVAQGTWIRTTIEVGPRHLARVVERARAMLAPPPPP